MHDFKHCRNCLYNASCDLKTKEFPERACYLGSKFVAIEGGEFFGVDLVFLAFRSEWQWVSR